MSGKETIKNSLGDIVENFTRAGYEVTTRPTLYGGETIELAETVSDGFDMIVCCGGDGTLNETVNGAMLRERPVRLGYIPCGSTNDFGNTIYDTPDVMNAVKCIIESDGHEVDCGKIADKYFVYTAAFGLFTDISYETPHERKAVWGHAAYLIEAVKNIGNIKGQQVKTITDTGETIEGNYLIGMITNADYIAGFQNITGKDISLQDGELELTLIARPDKPTDYGKVLQGLTEGTANEFVLRRKVRSVHFIFDEPTSFTVDGEYGGTYQEVDIQCIPEAFSLAY